MTEIKTADSRTKYRISAVLPTYNRPKFLESCLLSLYEQTFKDFEVIVIDDGSNEYESTFNKMICDTYKNLDMPVKYIKLHKNSGTVSIPRNIGIALATGEFIAPIDDDCWCMPNKLEILKDLMETNDSTVLAYGERVDCDIINGEIRQYGISNTKYLQSQKKSLGVDNGQFIFKNDAYNIFGPIFSINACDWETYKLLAEHGDFAYTPEIVCKYIWHETNSSRVPKERRIDPMKVLGEFAQYFVGTRFEDAVASKL